MRPRAPAAWRCPAAGIPGRRRAAPAPRRGTAPSLALHHQPRKGDIADDDALLLGHERQHHVAVARSASTRSASPKPGKHASSRSRICGASPGIFEANHDHAAPASGFADEQSSRRVCLIHVKSELRRHDSMVFGNARRGQPSATLSRAASPAPSRAPRRNSAASAGFLPARCSSVDAHGAVAAGDDERVEAEHRPRRARLPRRRCAREHLHALPAAAEARISHQAPGKGDRPRMRLSTSRGGPRPVDARLRLVDLRRVGDAGLALRRADRARRAPAPASARTIRSAPSLPGGRAGFPPCPPARSARARRGRPGRCRALPPCA